MRSKSLVVVVARLSFVIYGSHMNTSTTATLIKDAISSEERTYTWTANKAGMSPATMRRKLNGGADFTIGEVARIAAALGKAPADLLPREFRTASAA